MLLAGASTGSAATTVYPYTGAAFNGTTNDTAVFQAALDACFAGGGGEVQLQSGVTLVGGLKLRPLCHLRGSGIKATIIKCASNPCITQDSTESLPGTGFTDATLVPKDSTQNGDTALSLTSFQRSDIGRLYITGFASANPIKFGGTVPTTIHDPTLGVNVAFNDIHDILVNNTAGCMILQGVYSGSPPASPTQLVTLNTFSRMSFYGVSGKCIDMIRAVDSNLFLGGQIVMNANGSKAVVQGDDPSFPLNTTNVYVNSNVFLGYSYSTTGNQTVTFFSGNNGYATNALGLTTDQFTIPSTLGGITANATVWDPNSPCQYRVQGENMTGYHDGYLAGLNVDVLQCGLSWNKATILASPADGFTWAVPQATSVGVLSGTGALNYGTVQMPCGAPDHQRVTFATTGVTVQNLTVQGCAGDGETIFGAPSYVSSTAPFSLRYIKSSKTWVRDGGNFAWQGQDTISGLSDGFTLTAPSGYAVYTLSQTGAFSSGTITLPCAPPDGAIVTFNTTALTVPNLLLQGCIGEGDSIYGAPTYLAPNSPFSLRYIASSNFWMPLGVAQTWQGTGVTSVSATGFTLVSPTGYTDILISTSGTFASGTIQLPCGAPDGTEETYNTTQLTVTALTVHGCGGTGSVFGAPSTLSPTTPFVMKYVGVSSSWVRAR